MQTQPHPSFENISRHAAWLAVVTSGALGCPAGDLSPSDAPKPAPAPAISAAASSAGTGPGGDVSSATSPLRVERLGPLREDEKGGQLVVLLHGWGAPGDDLVPLARALARPGTRFLVPAGPLAETGGGRAWWHLDADRPAHAWKDELPSDYRSKPQVALARRAVQALLLDAKRRYAPDSIALAGFSQGAMLSLDVALAAAPAVDRVGVLSGVLIADSLPALHAQAIDARHPAVFVSHGTRDPMLPFRGGESIQTILKPRGFAVVWQPFEGGHEIPGRVVEGLRQFLFDAAPARAPE